MNFTAFPSRDEAMQAAASRLAEALQRGIDERGAACAALSGGSTPGPAYERLAQFKLDWSKLTFVLVDERFVPPGDSGSNEAMIRRALAPALAQGATLLPLYAPTATAADAAAIADAHYRNLGIDMALMGMGEDGHTASWFPGGPADALDPANPRAVVAVNAPGARGASERLTLTYAAIARARCTMLLITGDAKRAVLERALNRRNAPVAKLFELSPQPDVIWAA